MNKFDVGDVVVPRKKSVQGSESSFRWIGKRGVVVNPRTATKGVLVEFQQMIGDEDVFTPRLVYWPDSLDFADTGRGALEREVARLREAHKDAMEREAAASAEQIRVRDALAEAERKLAAAKEAPTLAQRIVREALQYTTPEALREVLDAEVVG